MIHPWGLLVLAATWSFAAWAVLGGIVGLALGWLVRGGWEAGEDRKALARIGDDQRAIVGWTAAQSAATPGPRETETALFQASNGAPVPSPRTWDKRLEPFGGPKTIAYEDLEGMFLDQFLLRFFHSLMPETWVLRFDAPGVSLAPWPMFVNLHPWAEEMPLLFEQMTGYTLNEIQLNNAIAEWARRLSKTSVSQ